MSSARTLIESETDPDPFKQFSSWYTERLKSGIKIPEAVSLATTDISGKVSVRTVLLKAFDNKGFTFYTNYNSRKAVQLRKNPRAAMLFYWPETARQVRIEGGIRMTTDKESREYFSTRPRESQISAWASEQSIVVPDRRYLEERFETFKAGFEGKQVIKPENWGGFRLIPDWFEFWQEREFRLHDRITYSRKGSRWFIRRLAP